MQDRIFHSICFGFILGVLLRSFWPVNLFLAGLAGVLGLAFFLIFSFASKREWGIIVSIFILAMCVGVWRLHLADQPAPFLFESKAGEILSLTGEIVDEPEIRENNQKLTIETGAGGKETKILATVDLDGDFRYGDRVKFSGKFEKPENFTTDQGKDFDYVKYLRKDDIFYVIGYPQIEILSHGHRSPIRNALFSAKEKILSEINLAVSREPENLLLTGLIVGERASFSQNLRQSLIDTGTIHIVALSGYNITVVAEWFIKLFSFLPRNLGFGAGLVSIILFIIMTGGTSTAIRAGVMASLAIVARATGRTYAAARALLLAGVLMIAVNPFVLAYDVSFELSFLATVAVIFLTPRVEKYFSWVTPAFKLRDVVSVTFAVYIFVLPFILYKMGNLSLVALPANILILPLIPLTMLLGFLTAVAGLISDILAVPLGHLSYLFLHYELETVNFFANLPSAAFIIPNFPLWLTLLIYAYFIYKLFGRSIKDFFTAPL